MPLILYWANTWTAKQYVRNSVFQQKQVILNVSGANNMFLTCNKCISLIENIILSIVLRYPVKFTNDFIAYEYKSKSNIYVSYCNIINCAVWDKEINHRSLNFKLIYPMLFQITNLYGFLSMRFSITDLLISFVIFWNSSEFSHKMLIFSFSLRQTILC